MLDAACFLETSLRQLVISPTSTGPAAEVDAWRSNPRCTDELDDWAPAFARAGAPFLATAIDHVERLGVATMPLGSGHARFAEGLADRVLIRLAHSLRRWVGRLASDYADEADWAYAGEQIGDWFGRDLQDALAGMVFDACADDDLLLGMLADVADLETDELRTRLDDEARVCETAGPALWEALGFTGSPPPVIVEPAHQLGVGLNGVWQPGTNRVVVSRDVLRARYATTHPAVDAASNAAVEPWMGVLEPCLALLRTGLQPAGHIILHEFVHAGATRFTPTDRFSVSQGIESVRGLEIRNRSLADASPMSRPSKSSVAIHEALAECIARDTEPIAAMTTPASLWDEPVSDDIAAFAAWGAPLVGYPDGPILLERILATSPGGTRALLHDERQVTRFLAALEGAFSPDDAAVFQAWYLTGDGDDVPPNGAASLRYWRRRLASRDHETR